MPKATLPEAGQRLLAAQYDNMNLCVRCGLCHSVCPTYQTSFVEPEGPRGRIAIAKALVEGHLSLTPDLLTHWDNCILCDACSAICPSGVRMEAIGQAVRAATVEAKGKSRSLPLRIALDWLLPNPALLRASMGLARIYQRSGLQKLARLSGALRLLGLQEADAMLPPPNGRPMVSRGQVYAATGEQRANVALLAGCIMSAAFGETDRATARVLAANGCRVTVTANQGCCGALHAHRGERARAQALARANIDAFGGAYDAVVVNAAGCGATMKHYGDLLTDDPAYAEQARAFSAKVKDFSEFLAALGPVKPTQAVNLRVTYQEPCHLANAQRIREAPRVLLRQIPGLELKEMAESSICCGSGALYNVTQTESSGELRTRKLRNAGATGADVIVTANPGCYMQLTQGDSGMRVMHIADLLDEAYRA